MQPGMQEVVALKQSTPSFERVSQQLYHSESHWSLLGSWKIPLSDAGHSNTYAPHDAGAGPHLTLSVSEQNVGTS